MNTEDFVTYEQAVKLKECGFDWPCRYYYNSNKSLFRSKMCALSSETTTNSYLDEIAGGMATVPTLAHAAKWLREEWGLHIEASPFTDCSIDADGRKCDEWEFWDFGIMRASNGSFVVSYGDREFATYESALSAGIDAALELIK